MGLGIRTLLKRFILRYKRRALDGQLQRFYTVRSDTHNTYLGRLADLHNTDKGTNLVNDNKFPWPCHTYTDYYESIFAMGRLSVLRVFECGIGSTDVSIPHTMSQTGTPGASLRMWRDYFPRATIYGADIDRNVLFEEDRIITAYVDQLCPDSIIRMWDSLDLNEVDVIIDDGLHTFDAGKHFYENSIGRLSSNGVYVIEDVTDDSLVLFMEYFAKCSGVVVEYVSLFDRIRQPFQNNLIVIRKMNMFTV